MKLPPRYQAVLRHVARYRLTLREVVGRLLLPSDQPITKSTVQDQRNRGTHILSRLRDAGLLHHHHHKSSDYPPFPGGVPYYTLTPAGAKLVGVPIDRSEESGKRTFGSDALAVHLATLWFATMRRRSCHRLEPSDLAPLFGQQKLFENVPHCLSSDPDGWRIYRLYVATTDLAGVLDHLQRQYNSMVDHETLSSWLPEDYAIATLAPEEQFCLDLKQAIERQPWKEFLKIQVALAPTPTTLRDLLKRYENGGLA